MVSLIISFFLCPPSSDYNNHVSTASCPIVFVTYFLHVMKGQGKQEWGHVNNARNGGQQQQVPSGLSDDVLRGRQITDGSQSSQEPMGY